MVVVLVIVYSFTVKVEGIVCVSCHIREVYLYLLSLSVTVFNIFKESFGAYHLILFRFTGDKADKGGYQKNSNCCNNYYFFVVITSNYLYHTSPNDVEI